MKKKWFRLFYFLPFALFVIFANVFIDPANIYHNNTLEMSLMDAEERQMVEYIWDLIPEEDRKGMSEDDVLLVLDLVDDYLEAKGLLVYHGDEAEYLDGDIDETDQLIYINDAVKKSGRGLTSLQIQLILDGELQYGIEQGYYEED